MQKHCLRKKLKIVRKFINNFDYMVLLRITIYLTTKSALFRSPVYIGHYHCRANIQKPFLADFYGDIVYNRKVENLLKILRQNQNT